MPPTIGRCTFCAILVSGMIPFGGLPREGCGFSRPELRTVRTAQFALLEPAVGNVQREEALTKLGFLAEAVPCPAELFFMASLIVTNLTNASTSNLIMMFMMQFRKQEDHSIYARTNNLTYVCTYAYAPKSAITKAGLEQIMATRDCTWRGAYRGSAPQHGGE